VVFIKKQKMSLLSKEKKCDRLWKKWAKKYGEQAEKSKYAYYCDGKKISERTQKHSDADVYDTDEQMEADAPAFFGRSPEEKAQRKADRLRKKRAKGDEIENMGFFGKKKGLKRKKDYKYQV
tara:strand:- start:159 stop:524 length:366 start_codon:yes stop_codon:yes gene_type:complete